jgi:hypothetical protein
MPIFTGYTVEEFTRVLTISRWIFGILAVCTIAAGVFTQWASSRLVELHGADRNELRELKEHLIASQKTLERMSTNSTEVADALAQLTDPRKITEAQKTALRKSLRTGPRGKVIVTFLSVEWDAEKYARQIADLLIAAGFDVSISDYLWVHLDDDGVFLCTREPGALPAQSPAAHIQRCFEAARIDLAPPVVSTEICQAVGAPVDATILVVSNRIQAGSR